MQDIFSQIILLVQQYDIPNTEPPGFFRRNLKGFLDWTKWISLFIVPFACVGIIFQFFSKKSSTSKLKYVSLGVLATCLIISISIFVFLDLTTTGSDDTNILRFDD